MEGVREAEIPLHVARRVIAIGNLDSVRQYEILPQSRAEEHVKVGTRFLPGIGDSSRGRHALLMIEMYVVIGDVCQLIVGEVKLRGLDTLALDGLKGDVSIGGEVAPSVVAGELDAADL